MALIDRRTPWRNLSTELAVQGISLSRHEPYRKFMGYTEKLNRERVNYNETSTHARYYLGLVPLGENSGTVQIVDIWHAKAR